MGQETQYRPNQMRPPEFSLTGLVRTLPQWAGDAIAVEIGSYQGESTLTFAKSGKFSRIYAIDPWSDEVYDEDDKATLHCPMGFVEVAFEINLKQYISKGVVHKLKGTGEQWIKEFMDNTVDFIYIDANHTYSAVKKDILMWKSKLRYGGILAGHDYGTHPGVKKAVDEIFGSPDKTFSDFSWMVRYDNL
jgi:hypothetical protein